MHGEARRCEARLLLLISQVDTTRLSFADDAEEEQEEAFEAARSALRSRPAAQPGSAAAAVCPTTGATAVLLAFQWPCSPNTPLVCIKPTGRHPSGQAAQIRERGQGPHRGD